MSVHTLHPDRIEETRQQAYSEFMPPILDWLVQRLTRGRPANLREIERSLIRLIEQTDLPGGDLEAKKEFAIELVLASLTRTRKQSDLADDPEDMRERRTHGRSEKKETLEEQLQSGLEASFPASDPPAVVSTAISGRAKEIVGTDEVLRQKKEAATTGEGMGEEQC